MLVDEICVEGGRVIRFAVIIMFIFVWTEMSFAEKNCFLISKHHAGKLEKDPLKLQDTIDRILQSFENKSALRFQPLFHSRLHRAISRIRSQFQRIATQVGGKADYSYMRIYALNTDGEALPIDCENGAATIIPLFGQDPQVVLWMQAAGKKEIVHIILHLTKDKGEWKISLWHDYPWTSGGVNPEKYNEEFLDKQKNPSLLKRYLFADMAYRLAKNSRYIQGELHKSLRKALKSEELKEVHTALIKHNKKDKFVHQDAGATKEGLILNTYLLLHKKMEKKQREEACKNAIQSVFKDPYFKDLNKISCSFVYPQHDSKKKSPLGQYLVSRK